ncbi:MAG: hypothetical protein AB9835_07585 [Eubacteriales bacterium]
MKKLITILIIITIVSTACVNNIKTDFTTENQNTTIDNTTTTIASSTEPATFDSSDGLPPVDDELKAFFKDAAKIYRDLEFGILPIQNDTGIQQDNYIYYRVNDPRFSTIKELRLFLTDYFTDDIIENDILSANKENPEYIEIDGAIYQREIGRGGRIEYAGHVFGPIEVSDSSINMPVSVYYATDYQPETFFYTEPDDKNKYNIEEHKFELVKVNDKWVFNQFYNFN